MGKTPERRVFASSSNVTLRYRRKVPPPNNQLEPQDAQPKSEPPEAPKPQQQQVRTRPHSESKQQPPSRSSRSPQRRRFRQKPRGRQPPSLLKQLLWKAKDVQPSQAPAISNHDKQDNNQDQHQNQQEEEDEDEEATFATQQRLARKQLAQEAVAAKRNKALEAGSAPETFVAESSSQETQSGSEDEAVFLPYNALVTAAQPPEAPWQVYEHQDTADDTDGEEASPVMPTETVQEQELEKPTVRRSQKLRQKQKLRLKQKQKRAAAKNQTQRLQQRGNGVEEERSQEIEESATASTDDDDIFHPPTNLASEMDAGVCRAVLSQLKEVVPFIVVGEVACPVMLEDHGACQPPPKAASDQDRVTAEDTQDFREHVVAMLDRSKKTQMQLRDSFVAESSGFDADTTYDFFKRRFTEVQRTAGIVYY